MLGGDAHLELADPFLQLPAQRLAAGLDLAVKFALQPDDVLGEILHALGHLGATGSGPGWRQPRPCANSIPGVAARGGGVQCAPMSVLSLIRHPGAPSAVSEVTAEAARSAPGVLDLRFQVADPARALELPGPAAPVRTDGLWRRTCFEAFLRAPGDEAYTELNLSPSGAWAAYRFDGYRSGMAAAEIPAPRILASATAGGFELAATIDLSAVGGLSGAWRLGLSAVIGTDGGRLSYWALAHPPGEADFHHPDGFALALAAGG